jgi:hypothetical protein
VLAPFNPGAPTMNYAALLAALRANPKSFLKSHYLKIRVLPSAVFGLGNYYFGGALDHNNNAQALRWGAGCFTRGSKVLNFVPHSMLFQLAPGDNNVAPQNLAATSVWVVPAELASTVDNYAALAGGLVTLGPDIMITTLLNGCTFCCADSPGGVLMKHIQPVGATNHVVLATAVNTNGALVGETAGTFRFFGSGGFGYNEGTEDVTVIGVRGNGRWAVYAQVHSRNLNSIVRVTKFFQQ